MAEAETAGFGYPDPRNGDLHDLYVEFIREEANFVLRFVSGFLREQYKRDLRDLFLYEKKLFWNWFVSLSQVDQSELRYRWSRGFKQWTQEREEETRLAIWQAEEFGSANEE